MFKALLLIFLSLPAMAGMTPVKYPFRAEQLRISGFVNVKYDINNRGEVENIRVVEASPEGVFEREVFKGMRVWTFIKDHPKKNASASFVFKK